MWGMGRARARGIRVNVGDVRDVEARGKVRWTDVGGDGGGSGVVGGEGGKGTMRGGRS
jgi:hypothetical protein